MACLHLVERCAGILSSVRQEIDLAGPAVHNSLAEPLATLVLTFKDVELLMQKQAERPFIKRYLKRGSIADHIKGCHEKLTDNLSLFGVTIVVILLRLRTELDIPQLAIQIRMFHEIHDLHQKHPATVSPPTYSTGLSEASTSNLMLPPTSSKLLPDLASHHNERLALDTILDNADLRHVLRQALGSNSDSRLIEVS